MILDRVLQVIGMCAAVAACGPPPSNVEGEWRDAIARLDFTSIYPITEDLQPGDVLLSIPRTSGPLRPLVQRLGAIDPQTLKDSLGVQEKERMSFQITKTPDAVGAAPAAADTSKPSAAAATGFNLTANYPGAANITTQVKVSPMPAATSPAAKGQPPSPPNPVEPDILNPDTAQSGTIKPRLRRVGIPYAAAARVYQGDLGAGGPLGVGNLGGALGFHGDAAILISLRQLETLGFDTVHAVDLLYASRLGWLRLKHLTAPRMLAIASSADNGLAARLCQGAAHPGKRAVIEVVNTVLYAHQIEFEYQSESSYAGKLAFAISQSGAGTPGLGTSGLTAPAPAAGSGAVPPPAATEAGAAVQQLNGLVSALAVPSSPGVRLGLGVGSSGGVALVENFNQPMAVGYIPVAQYSVRGSLIYSSEQPDVENEAKQLHAMCLPFLPKREVETVTDPIDQLACANTKALLPFNPPPFIPERCSEIEKEEKNKMLPQIDSEALTPISRQDTGG